MPIELRLTFPDPDHVSVSLLGEEPDHSPPAEFSNPLGENVLKELGWYLEDYGTGYTAGPDDARAGAVEEQLPGWGTALFEAAVESGRKAAGLFDRFLEAEEEGRVLSIAADHPAVLSLPWELLHTPGGSFLVNENPPVSVRRGLPAAGQGRSPRKRGPKPRLHLLFIISRPEGAGFINPRSDAEAVLNALARQKQERAEVEFLRPATLDALRRRLRDRRLPRVDIIHFDGHGVFGQDRDAEKAGKGEFSKGDGAAGDKRRGWLLFEDRDGGKDEVSAREFGDLLFRNQAGLVVLSACQSAAMGEEDPMSGCAARLVHAGIPAVIAMTHSVLVSMAERLFAEFYRNLFEGRPVARSLDEARHDLLFNPERGVRLRGEYNSREVPLKLRDWFLPALYQSGADRPLLKKRKKKAGLSPSAKPQPSGFFGRGQELWRIERAFSVQGTRRLSVTGFGGQGKTALALEAGRWLCRTRLFERACFVSFADWQGIDPVGVTVSTLGTVLEESLPDAAAAEQALAETPCLLILDNLETLADIDGGRGLSELLTAAVPWSEAGQSRVLLTSRRPDFNHPDYPTAGSYAHQRLDLQGLQAKDAVAWFDELRRLPPAAALKRPRRDVLIRLFKQVGFHPLSIGILAAQLKVRGPAEVGERLEALLEEQPVNRDDRTLLASLELSLERLPAEAQALLPRLGVFQGGCLEEMVGRVTGLEEADWPILREALSRTGLMEAKRVPETDKTFLRFHPTLAPALWRRLDREEQARLSQSHWRAYYALSGGLYVLDRKKPHTARALARAELANLLRAVYACLHGGQEQGPDFAVNVNRFLNAFGLRREHQALAEEAAEAGKEVGSQGWFLARSSLGEQLFSAGQIDKAEAVFREILKGLGQEASYQRCLTLNRLGRCDGAQGRLVAAEQGYQQELEELAQLEQSKGVRRQTGAAWMELADVLRDQGQYDRAEEAYESALEIDEELGELRNIAVDNAQLGTLALLRNRLSEAAKRHQAALTIFRGLNEPASEAVFLHQLGMVYQKAEDWQAAEDAYRQSARLTEEQGMLAGGNGVGSTWNQLAQVCWAADRPTEAETWYDKALAVCRRSGDRPGIAQTLSNLAALLQATDQSRLDEARSLAQESLAIEETLDPAATEIWMTYNLLADIATRQGDSSRAAAFRTESRQAYAAFPGARQQVQRHAPLIAAVAAAVADPEARAELEPGLDKMIEQGWGNLIAAVRSLLAGERDEAALCGPLDYEDAAVIRAVLEGLADAAA